MKRLDKNLTEMFFSALKEAKETRDAKGITTMDIFKELLEDADSILYEYLADCSHNDTIEYEISAFMEELAQKENISYDVVYYLKKGNKDKEKILITQELFNYLKKAEELSGEEDEIIPNDLAAAIFDSPPKSITRFIRAVDGSMADIKELFNSAYETLEGKVPEEMSSYLSILEEDENILGRDKVVDEIWTILLKKTKRNLVLVGEPGVGKTAIVKKLVSEIKRGTSPKDFRGFTVYALDVNSVISGTKYRGDAEKRFKDIISFMETRKNAILFIDEAHMIIGTGKTESSDSDLGNALKPILASDNSRVIAATTKREYEKYFSKDAALKRRFEKVVVDEPKFTEVYSMIKSKVETLTEYHKVKISPKMVEFIALYASCFNFETRNPDRTLDLIDRSMVTAKRKGKNYVDKESILSNFKVNMAVLNNMSENERKATAYHEVGHYLAIRFLPYPNRTRQIIAVSIYPTEDYLGVTVWENRKNVFLTSDYQSYLEKIAVSLAGGIAESLITKKNDGVSADSKKATELARLMIAKTGFYDNFFYQIDELKSERNTNKQIEDVKKVIEKAREVAEKIIKEREPELRAIAEELLKKKVLSNKELEAIVTKVQKEREANNRLATVQA